MYIYNKTEKMKNALLLFILSISLNSVAQDMEQQNIYTSKTGWKIIRSIKNSSDTTIFFFWSFQNAKYTAITDLGSIFLTTKDDVEAFATKLKEFSGKPAGSTVSSTVGNITFQLYDFSNDIYIQNEKGKYFMYSKKASLKVADEILLNSHLME